MSRSFSIAAFAIVTLAINICSGQYQQHRFASYPTQDQFVPAPARQNQPIPAQQVTPMPQQAMPMQQQPMPMQQQPAPAQQYAPAQQQYIGSPNYGGPVYESAVAGDCCGDCNSASCGGCFGGCGGRRHAPLRKLAQSCRVQPECADCNWGPFYLSLFGGVSFLDNFDTRFTFDNGIDGELGVQETGFSMEDGVASGASIGRYFYRQARVELEYTYRDNAVGDFQQFTYSDDLSTPQINDTLIASISLPAEGSIESSSVVVNFVFDLKPRTVGCMNSYLGGGLGGIAFDGNATVAGSVFNFDDSAFAFQGLVGANYAARERLDLFTEYRYLGSDSVKVEQVDMAGNVTNPGAFRFDSHNVVFGIRILR